MGKTYRITFEKKADPNTDKLYTRQLKPLEPGGFKRRKIASFDIEDDGQGNFIFGVVWERTSYKAFRSKLAMAKYMSSRRFRGYWFTGTNVEYDIGGIFLPEYAENLNLSYGATFMFGSLRINSRGKHNSYIYFVDTVRHVPKSVAKLGDLVGKPKLEMPKALTTKVRNKTPLTEADYTEIETYCARDAEISYLTLALLQDEYNKLGTSLRFSAAGSALELFRRLYLKGFVPLPETKFAHEFFKGYYGGRTECFFRGILKATPEEPICAGDINSMYPFIMLEGKLPVISELRYTLNLEPETFISEYLSFPGMSDVLVYAPKQKYQILPCRIDSKLLFPHGTFRGHYCHNELVYAVKNGYKILKVFKTFYSPTFCNPFREYVSTIYTERKKAEKIPGMVVVALALKILLNGLYGKFAQIKECSSLLPVDVAIKKANVKGIILDSLSTITIEGKPFILLKEKLEGEKLPLQSNVIWSAYITAGGRVLLHQKLVEYQGFYCDTDCIYTYSEVFASDELGALALEAKGTQAFFFLPKVYFFKHIDGTYTRKAKGFNEKTANCTLEDFLARCTRALEKPADHNSPEKITVEFEKPIRIRSAGRLVKELPTRNGLKKPRVNLWYKFKKTYKSIYSKGKTADNGIVRSLHLCYSESRGNHVTGEDNENARKRNLKTA
jgi:hypothetical protein